MADDGDGENGGALLSDPVDVVIDKLLRYVPVCLSFLSYFTRGLLQCSGENSIIIVFAFGCLID